MSLIDRQILEYELKGEIEAKPTTQIPQKGILQRHEPPIDPEAHYKLDDVTPALMILH